VALDLLERHSLSPMELRILLAVRDRERPESELATRVGGHRMSLRPSAGALYARGFLRWRHAPGDDDSWFSLTPAGRLLLRPLLSAVAE
jgi:DNA-binding MarR family transcriptional regulator